MFQITGTIIGVTKPPPFSISSTNCGCVQHRAFTAAGGIQHRGQQPVQNNGQHTFN